MIIDEKVLMHYGTPRHSGRYPWGSGGNETMPRNPTLLDHIENMKKQGLKEKEIAQGLGMSIQQLRAEKSNAKTQKKAADIAQVQRLKDKGWGPTAIGRHTGLPEATVRSYLKPGADQKATTLETTTKSIKEQVDKKTYLDVGKGVSNYVGVSQTTMNNAISVLRAQGYNTFEVPHPQVTSGHDTNMKILVPPGYTQRDVFLNRDKIQQFAEYTENGGRSSFIKPHYPMSLDPSRVAIRYASEGGKEADGVLWVRPGVKDVELGGAQYAQVRVLVGDKHYLKGMAVYKNDLPHGVDVMFNTNKNNTGNKFDALKKLEDDPDLPFGSVISRQIFDNPESSTRKLTSTMNLINEQGEWGEWSRTLSSQMLSKQSPRLAKTQLDMTYEFRQQDYENIMKLTNPTVRKKLLLDFADGADSAAVHLKAAQMPRQAVAVILPIKSLKPSEVYAPRFNDGDRVVLIRHPHGGTFEIPELTVNKRNREARGLLGPDSQDAIGIHHTVASRLSGADFDGDTVLVIPNHHGRITTSPALEGLKDFDPVRAYPGYPGMKIMANTQTEMGKISNLITDMSIRGAPHDDLAAAVRHSMVVIDAEKKGLNHKLSYNENGIGRLVRKYQLEPAGKRGASTLISRKKSEIDVPERKPRPRSEGGPIDPVTGELRYVPTNKKSYITGKPRQVKVKALAEARDAHALSSGTRMEALYADHSNKLKAMANQARLDAIKTPRAEQSASAKKAYEKEVASLNHKLTLAEKNAPLERQANVIARSVIRTKIDANPGLKDDKDTMKKIEQQAINDARARVGASKHDIKITPEEWDAIQAGAISDSKLTSILAKADMDIVRQLATPKPEVLMSSNMTHRAENMIALGYDRSEIAEALGVSLSTLDRATKGE